MAVDGGRGPKGNPLFDADGGIEDWVDLGEVGEYAARVGNRIVGTRAERLELITTPGAEKRVWEGLEFEQTDGVDKGTWKYLDGAWRPAKVPMAVEWTAPAPQRSLSLPLCRRTR